MAPNALPNDMTERIDTFEAYLRVERRRGAVTIARYRAIVDDFAEFRDLAGVAWFAREVDDLWSTFWLLTRGVARRVDAWGTGLEEGIRPRTLTGLIMWGSGYEAALPLLHDLRREASHAWQADLDAGPSWDELVPDHDTAHFELGAVYWQAGFIEDGITECRIAVALKPDWELPQVEIGIIFLNAKRFEEARSHLEAVYAAAKAPTSHLKFNLGSAKWRCGFFAEGLSLFEEVLSDEACGSYPHALDQAAHCAFMVGDDVRGAHTR